MNFSGREAAMMRRHPYLHHVCATSQDGVSRIPVDEVFYFSAGGSHTTVVTGTEEHRISTPLAELLALLDPEKFLQVHRSTVVNVDRIENVIRQDQDQLVLKFKGRDECITVDQPFCRQFPVR
jgi:DNA-binding LytR/AlgR family response regulator